MRQSPLPLFKDLMPFGGQLDSTNKWLKLSELVPWEKLDKMYLKYFKRPGAVKDSRLILGMLIGKHFTKLSDREIIDYFHENPYFQYFCGMSTFVTGEEKKVFHHSLLSKRRSKLGKKYFSEFERAILEVLKESGVIKSNKLILDATVAPSHVEYPNDVKLMNVAREWLCKTILELKNKIDPKLKIRTYRRKARTLFLYFQKKKKKSRRIIQQAKKKMSSYLRRNIEQVEKLISSYEKLPLDIFNGLPIKTIKKHVQTAKEIYHQQIEMIREKTTRVSNRIVSFHQPQVRPIVRGKEGKRVEFGPKELLAYVGGYVFLDNISFDNFNEGIYLEKSLKKHEERFGQNPKVVCADGIFSNRYNRQLLKDQKVEHSFKHIGKATKKVKARTKKLRKLRNEVEGVIGTLKERWGLNRIIYTIQDGETIQNYLAMGVHNLNKAAKAM